MIFALYHHPNESAGLIREAAKDLKLPFQEIHLYEGDGLPRDTSDLEGLVVMGGSMNVDEVYAYPFLLPEVQLIEKVLKENKPVLGICLGSQLIAKALGARVYPNAKREVGWHSVEMTFNAAKDPLFSTFPKELDVLHWHGDTFDMPEGAVHLAQSKDCKNQAFRWGRATYGLQFHLEVTPGMVQSWLEAESDKTYVRGAGEEPSDILKKTPKAFERVEPMARSFFSSYLKSAYRNLTPVA